MQAVALKQPIARRPPMPQASGQPPVQPPEVPVAQGDGSEDYSFCFQCCDIVPILIVGATLTSDGPNILEVQCKKCGHQFFEEG